jgi:hypothetical protein
VEIVDETVLRVPRDVVVAFIADRSRWATWWPGAEVTVVADLGAEGMRWTLAGTIVGASEVRVTVLDGGIMVRYQLRADPVVPGTRRVARRLPASPHGRRELESLRLRHAMAWKRSVWSLREDSGADERARA